MEEVLRVYYSSPRNPIGADGDYYTSADLDPIFGKLLAKQFGQMADGLQDMQISPPGEEGWLRHQENDAKPPNWRRRGGRSFTIIELGAGKGLLARDILQHTHFPYMILERSPAMRARQQELLRDYDVTWVDDLPRGITGCIFSNEFFDALPVHRVVRRGGVLKEIYVTENLEEIEGDLQEPIDAPLVEGQTAEINLDARRWIRRIAESLDRGYHIAIDYGYLAKEFYAQPHGTLMCYWRHQGVENPYVHIGEQDMTAHVNFSDLMEEGAAARLETVRLTTQMDFLIGHGILDEIQRLATAGDAASMKRLLKIKRLILPGSMGERFKVLIQRRLQ